MALQNPKIAPRKKNDCHCGTMGLPVPSLSLAYCPIHSIDFFPDSSLPYQPDNWNYKGTSSRPYVVWKLFNFHNFGHGYARNHLTAHWSSHGSYNFRLDFCSPQGTVYLLFSASSCSFVRSSKWRQLMYSCGMSVILNWHKWTFKCPLLIVSILKCKCTWDFMSSLWIVLLPFFQMNWFDNVIDDAWGKIVS